MSTPITTWIRAFFALRERANEQRGFIELNPGTPEAERWPRTTGADVLLIGSIIDPLAVIHVADSTVRRWQLAMADVEDIAAVEPDDLYIENRAFWRTLAATFVDFHADGVPLLEESVWTALLSKLGTTERRNAGPDIVSHGPFTEGITHSELYRQIVQYLFTQRGFDLMDAPADHPFGGVGMKIPRATNADVLRQATYWSNELADTRHIPGYDYVAEHWAHVVADVDKLAKAGKPDEVYAKNNEFWREVPNVAAKITEAGERPTKTDLILGSLADSIAHLPDTIGDAARAVAQAASNIAGKAANAAGHVAGEAGKGFFSGVGGPLVLGAAGVLGIYLLTRRRSHEDAEA